ncbi:MAG: imidazolonepropionase [Candidatus Riflebacteria bacterium]|nr:imidazolonepropionase [Candidatus Riflebacteria bacterium]
MEKKSADFILRNAANIVVYPFPYRGKGTVPSWQIEEIPNASLAAKDGIITWIGSTAELEKNVKIQPDAEIYDAEGLIALPAFVDSHTHLVYGGNRADEFEMRVSGASYLDIHAKGGGILNSTRAVQNMTIEELFNGAAERIERLMLSGVTTVEIKSGYGLDLKNEIKMLETIQMLQEAFDIRIVPTFMGAHAIPADRAGDPEKFIDEFCNEWIPAVAEKKLAVFNDVFTEKSVFSVEQSRKILEAGLKYGLKPKIHADEVNVIGAVDLAVEVEAVSADHLLKTEEAGIEKMKGSGVIPTLLPGTSTFLMEKRHANARKMIEAGLPVAIASDHNPGSCQFLEANLIQSFAMLQLKMTAAEALIAGTLHAAYAVGLGDKTGSLEVGKAADIALYNLSSYKEIAYKAGCNCLYDLFCDGVALGI